MPQINRFFINSYFDISRNTNVNLDNFSFDYILNLDLSLYPQFTDMSMFFTTYNYTINSDLSIGTINLILNKDLVKILLTYDFNKYSKNGIIKFDPANPIVFINPNFGTLTHEPCKFAYRILEIIATKLFGNSEDYVLIENGFEYYNSEGECLINKVIDDIGNLFNDSTVLNNIMTTYQNSLVYDNTPGTHNFDFYNSIWEFPMFYSGNVSFVDGETTNNFNGPNMGGAEIDNGSYSIPILLRFWGLGGNAPLQVTVVAGNLSAIITWLPPVSFKNITGYLIKWTGNFSSTFLINEITINTNGTNTVTINNLTGGNSITFTVTAISGSVFSAESLPSNSINLTGPPAIISNLSGISGYTNAYLTWTPPYNNGFDITGYKFFYNLTSFLGEIGNFTFITTWLDANESYTLTLGGSNNVTNWTDRKNGSNFTSSSLNVTYDSTNKFVNFSSTDGYLSFDNSIINNVTRYAFFFVASFATLSQYIFIKQHDGTSTMYLGIGIQDNSTQINDGKLYWFNNNNSSFANSNTSFNINTIYLFTVYYDGVNFNFRINGELDSSTPGNFSIYNDTNATFSNLGNFSEFPFNNNWNLYEFIYCNTNVSIDNIELIESYLNFKHNLQLDKYKIVDISSNNTYSYSGYIDLNNFIFLNLLENNKYVIDSSNNLASSIDGLYNSTSYNIEVSAINLNGTAGLSNTISLTTGNKADYPSNLYGLPSFTKVFIAWTPPLTTNPSDVISYNIYSSSGTFNLLVSSVYSYSDYIDFTNFTFLSLFDTNSFIVDLSGNYACVISNLTTGTQYTIQVSALTSSEETLKSNTIILTPITQPSAPLDLIITPFDNSVTFQWKAPTDNGGSDIAFYSVSRSSVIIDINGTHEQYDLVTEKIDVNTLEFNNPYYSHSISGLLFGNIYTVNIHAINSANIAGLDISGTFVLGINPLPPINLTILNTTLKSISFYWNDNIFPPNYTNTYSSYNITLNPSDASGSILTNKGNTYYFNTLTPNTNYTISVSTVDSSGYVSIPATINAFTGIKYASNFYLLNQPYNQYAFIFTPGGLDNISTTDYYLTVFDNNNTILYSISFGPSFSGNAVYDSTNNIWAILIPQIVNLTIGNNYNFNLLVYPYTSTSNYDSSREINISLSPQANHFYIFKTVSLNNNMVFNFYPPYLSTSIGDVTNTSYDLNIPPIINDVVFTDQSYNILDLTPNNDYTGTLTSSSNAAGSNQSNISFYNYQYTDLSATYIAPQTQNSNDLGNWVFNWTKPVENGNDILISQSFIISTTNTDLSSNIVFYKDAYFDTSVTISLYDLINKFGYNLEMNYFKIIGYWTNDLQTQIIGANSNSFLPVVTPLPPTNLIISDSDFNSLTISWTPSIYPSIAPQTYTYINYRIIITSTDSGFKTINKVISYTGISFYIINNLYYGAKFSISISTIDNLNQTSTSLSINSYTGNKYATNIFLLNQPNNLYLFTFTPGTLDIFTTTDYCLTIFDLNNSNLGTVVFGATSSGVYNSNTNTWNYLLPDSFVFIDNVYTFNLLVYPTGINNIDDTNREINITLQRPTYNYYITKILTSSFEEFLIWSPTFINSFGLTVNNYVITISTIPMITTTDISTTLTMADNTLYDGSIITNMSDNITSYTSNFYFYNYIVTNASSNFIQPTNLSNDLGIWQFTWTNPDLNGNDILINQSFYIQDSSGYNIYTQSCFSNTLNLSVNNLVTLNYYDLSQNTFIIKSLWMSDTGTMVINSVSTIFSLPQVNPVVQATDIGTDYITISWNFYNPSIINQYQMTINGTGYYTTPPDTSYTFTGLDSGTSYDIVIWALDINNNPISDNITLNITTN